MSNKDWKGNRKSVFSTLGASNHTEHDRAENDYYATDPIAADLLCDVETFSGTIWENSCGEGHLSKRLVQRGYSVISTDLIDRGYGEGGVDFFDCTMSYGNNIVTNPPYSLSKEWVYHSMELLNNGEKLALFLPIQFLESEERRELFNMYPPRTIYVCSGRILCGINGNFYKTDDNGNIILNKKGQPQKMSSAKCYAWFVWEKGIHTDPIIKWIN